MSFYGDDVDSAFRGAGAKPYPRFPYGFSSNLYNKGLASFFFPPMIE